jgi:hypothetical protein
MSGPDAAAAAEAAPGESDSRVCAACGAAGRYRCPRCGVRSCSAACVSAHKTAAGCTGRRDRAAFVPLGGFSDATLLSDLRLLEETQFAADRAKRARAAEEERRPPALPRPALTLQRVCVLGV